MHGVAGRAAGREKGGYGTPVTGVLAGLGFAEAGAHGRVVGPLDVIGVAAEALGGELPVGVEGPLVHAAYDLGAALGAVEEGVEVPGHLAEVVEEGRGFGVEGGEVEAAIVVDLGDGHEAPLGGVEFVVVGLLETGDGDELAVGAVGPAVVGADEGGGVAGVGAADAVAAVSTDVEEGVNLAGGVAGDEDGVLAHVGGEEVAGVGYLGLVAEEEPAAGEDALLFLLVDVGFDVDAAADQTLG